MVVHTQFCIFLLSPPQHGAPPPILPTSDPHLWSRTDYRWLGVWFSVDFQKYIFSFLNKMYFLLFSPDFLFKKKRVLTRYFQKHFFKMCAKFHLIRLQFILLIFL